MQVSGEKDFGINNSYFCECCPVLQVISIANELCSTLIDLYITKVRPTLVAWRVEANRPYRGCGNTFINIYHTFINKNVNNIVFS